VQRAAIAVEIQDDWSAFARSHVPGENVLAVGRRPRDFLGARQASLRRCGVDRFGKLHQRTLRDIKQQREAGINTERDDCDSYHRLCDPSRPVPLRPNARRCTVGEDKRPPQEFPRFLAAALNRMEKLRDPSHTRALPLSGLRALFAEAGLPEPCVTHYDVRADLDRLLAITFPAASDDIPVIRKHLDQATAIQKQLTPA